jgi:hypothetical protein
MFKILIYDYNYFFFVINKCTVNTYTDIILHIFYTNITIPFYNNSNILLCIVKINDQSWRFLFKTVFDLNKRYFFTEMFLIKFNLLKKIHFYIFTYYVTFSKKKC